jgi:hypothetical protein
MLSIFIPFFSPNNIIFFTQDSSSRNNTEKTLHSLKKIDPNDPFYIMRYYGDYGFQDVVENGYSSISFKIEKGWGCTCFVGMNSSSDLIFGRNFDWSDDGTLFLYTEPSYGYASISTINFGILGLSSSINKKDPTIQDRLLQAPYYLMDGMNEKGLTVGIMAIERSSRTYNASQPTISSLDLIRLALEFTSTVDEVLILWNGYNIEFGSVPIHYLIADPQGNSAIVEFIDGDMHVYRNENSWQVSTNFIFTDGIASCWRYQTATQILQETWGNISIEEGMEILEQCAQDGLTRWSSVYNMEKVSVSISVNQNYDRTYFFRF